MRRKLFEAEGDTFLVFIEIEDNDLDLLVELDDFFRVVDPAPAEVGDVDQAVDAAEVDEYTVGSDVLDGSFEDLAFFELA